MSLVLAGLIAAGAGAGALVGRWWRRRGAQATARDAKEDDAKKKDGEGDADVKKVEDAPARANAKPVEAKPAAPPARKPVSGAAHGADPLAGFPCQLGDVVTRLTGEEAWLAGGLVFSEDVPVAVLYVAPDAGADTVLYARPKPRDCLLWLAPLDPGAILVGGEPPTSVEHDGVRFDRTRRLPLHARRVGVGAPDVGDAVLVAEYASTGSERLLLVKSGAAARAYRGLELEPSTYDIIASGKSTLDDA